jgi:hypothetical protein
MDADKRIVLSQKGTHPHDRTSGADTSHKCVSYPIETSGQAMYRNRTVPTAWDT